MLLCRSRPIGATSQGAGESDEEVYRQLRWIIPAKLRVLLEEKGLHTTGARLAAL